MTRARWIAGVIPPLVAAAPLHAESTAPTATTPWIRLAASDDAPTSKDALFGLPSTPAKKDEPATKDALFGTGAAADESAIKWSGMLDGLGAYTYSDPTHWSRGVGRLGLTAQGAFSENVKWKLSGRVDGDIVYATSNFYLEPVKRNQQFSAFWGENYLDISAGSWDFRLGTQQIIWGEVVGLFFADVVSAKDEREFLLPTFDLIRIPQLAARAEYFSGDSHLELIWIPIPAFDRIGKPGADFYPAPLPSPTPASVAALFNNPETPTRSLSNSNYGVRFNTLVSGWDLAAFYYRSMSTQPTFYRLDTGNPAQPFVFQPRYDRIWQAGGTVSKDLGDMVLRAEAVYANGQGYSVTTLSAPQGVLQKSTFDYIVSAEWALPGDTRLNLQAFQRVFFDGGGRDLVVRSDGFGMGIFVSTKWTDALEPQILYQQNFDHAGGIVRPRLNWTAGKNATVAFGVDIFVGPNDGFFGRYNNRDRVYSESRYDF
ncbi:MAG TPA: DUF1302 family protein [Casimicrobiaceae bacterium]|nr:DUF1302 family protein [Casimicrobiaceae bacterium]